MIGLLLRHKVHEHIRKHTIYPAQSAAPQTQRPIPTKPTAVIGQARNTPRYTSIDLRIVVVNLTYPLRRIDENGRDPSAF